MDSAELPSAHGNKGHRLLRGLNFGVSHVISNIFLPPQPPAPHHKSIFLWEAMEMYYHSAMGALATDVH